MEIINQKNQNPNYFIIENKVNAFAVLKDELKHKNYDKSFSYETIDEVIFIKKSFKVQFFTTTTIRKCLCPFDRIHYLN